VQLPDYLTPGLLDFESGNSPVHSSPDHHFCSSKVFCFFSPFFQFVPNSLSKKTKLVKGDLLNASDSHKNFFLNRCVMKYYAISNGHIGDGYREIQEIGGHRLYLQTLTGWSGSRINICSRSWNCLSFDVFLDPEHHGLEMGGTTGDHERGLLAPLCHCLTQVGVVFSYLVIIKSMTHTTRPRFRAKRYNGTPLAVLRPYRKPGLFIMNRWSES
jgi:hypothetical protein